MIQTNQRHISGIQSDQLWFRYIIGLGVTALPPAWSLMGIISSSWAIQVLLIMYALSGRLIHKRGQPDWQHWGDLHFLRFLVECLLIAFCFAIFLFFLKEIPFARVPALMESPSMPWIWWGFLALLQLRECLVTIAQNKRK